MLRRFLQICQAFTRIPFVRDIFTMQIGKFIYTIVVFGSSIVFARTLGIEEYGIYVVTFSFVSTIKVFTNLGQGSSLQVFFSEEYGKKNTQGMARVLRNYINVSFVNALLLGALALAASFIADLLYDNSSIGQYAQILFLFHIIEIGNSGMLIILQSIRRIRLKTVLEQSANISILLCAIALITLGFGIWGIVMSYLCISGVFLIISIITYRSLLRKYPLPHIRDVLRVPPDEAHPYLVQGLIFSVDKNIGGLYPNGLFFILSLVAPPATVGIARIALQFASLPQMLLHAPVGSLSETVLANLRAQGSAVLRKNAIKVIKHSLFFHIIISLGLLFVIPPTIILLYGHTYAGAIPIALWIIVLAVFIPLSIINSPLLRLYRKIHYSIGMAIINIAIQWSSLYFIAKFVSPEIGFVVGYSIGHLFLLILTAYVLLVLLKPQPS